MKSARLKASCLDCVVFCCAMLLGKHIYVDISNVVIHLYALIRSCGLARVCKIMADSL